MTPATFTAGEKHTLSEYMRAIARDVERVQWAVDDFMVSISLELIDNIPGEPYRRRFTRTFSASQFYEEERGQYIHYALWGRIHAIPLLGSIHRHPNAPFIKNRPVDPPPTGYLLNPHPFSLRRRINVRFPTRPVLADPRSLPVVVQEDGNASASVEPD